MHYEAVQICNNNVVLARKASGDQVVVVGKGVGYGLRRGSYIDDDIPGSRVFSILDGSVDLNNVKHLDYDTAKVKRVTREIVHTARNQLGIENEKLYDALYDHIVFAIERLKIGLPIENPFITEISVLCNREFDVAELAAQLIRRELDVDIGEAERGFIALHLYSARGNLHISAAMRNARVYQDAVNTVDRLYGMALDENASARRVFLTTLNHLVAAAQSRTLLDLPVRHQVCLSMNRHYRTAQALDALLARELEVELSDDALAYLALTVSLVTQR